MTSKDLEGKCRFGEGLLSEIVRKIWTSDILFIHPTLNFRAPPVLSETVERKAENEGMAVITWSRLETTAERPVRPAVDGSEAVHRVH